MEFRIGELCRKEVIDVMDGSRYGYVGDAEIDLETGQVAAVGAEESWEEPQRTPAPDS